MRVLDVTIDLGSGATPYQLESAVRAMRVATEVARDAETRQIRRSAEEQCKFPTDDELGEASNRLPGGDERSPRRRAQSQLEARRRFARDVEHFPPDLWYERWYRRQRESPSGYSTSFLSLTGHDRALSSSIVPWAGATVGLDVMDPELYRALVSDRVARLLPTDLWVRSISYENPFNEVVAGVKAGEAVVKSTAGVIETAATLGSRRRVKRAEAAVAEQTIESRVTDTELDVELKREALRRARIENEMLEEELANRRLKNVEAVDALSAARRQQALVDHFLAVGALEQADSIAALDPADAGCLVIFAVRGAELQLTDLPDPDDESLTAPPTDE